MSIGRRDGDRYLLAGVILPVLLVCAGALADPVEQRATIVATMQAWERAVEMGDYEELARYYASDAVYYPNGGSPIVGRSGIIERNHERGLAVDVDITQYVDDIKIHGSWAIYSCLARISLQGADDVGSTRYARVLLVMQKGADGQWRILRDIDNDTPDRPTDHGG